MKAAANVANEGWGASLPRADGGALADVLLRFVDSGLFGVICVAPFFFAGRHDVGRLVFVSFVAVTAAAWFLRQATLEKAAWPRTSLYAFVLLAAAMLVLQVVPLPAEWLHRAAPRLAELLPLWSFAAGDTRSMGTWRTISLVPHETIKSLAVLLSYGLLLAVVAGRIQSVAHVRRLLGWVGLASVAMAVFGVLQYFTSDGRFFWFYAHPYRSATASLSGAFINRNHFAHFLILGVGPLVAWLLHLVKRSSRGVPSHESHRSADLAAWLVAAAIVSVMLISIASRSRGGAVTLIVAVALLIAIYWGRGIVDGRFLFGLIGLAAIIGAVMSMRGYDHVVDRLDDLTEGSIEELDRSGIRRQVWAANVAAIRSFPVFGTGAGGHCEICPVFLGESCNKEYTHAENGYLQVVTENGAAGAVLLLAVMVTVGGWCLQCYRSAQPAEEVYWFGAATAGLVSSAVHSLVDFVWYIPACMSVTVVLAACVLRLSQLAGASNGEVTALRVLPRGRWIELAAVVILIGAWTVWTYVGPAMAAVHWDRYLRASVASSKLADETIEQFVSGKVVSPQEVQRRLSHMMLRHLEATIRCDPRFARAHRRLADRYMAEFELDVSGAANILEVSQIRDATRASSFASADELRAWLVRAFGPNVRLLYRAQVHARRALELCPLQGDVYLRMAELAFLDMSTPETVQAHIEQGLRVRPNDRNVLIRAGRQEFLVGQIDLAVKHWAKCFNTPGRHQREIIYRLVHAGMPAKELLEFFQPDWRTLPDIWDQYKNGINPSDLGDVLAYSEKATRREIADPRGMHPVHVWYLQSKLYAETGRAQESLRCLKRAYHCDPRKYFVRQALARMLQIQGSFTEAEPHVRWCLARKPSDKALRAALENITKARIEQRKSAAPVDSRWKPNTDRGPQRVEGLRG